MLNQKLSTPDPKITQHLPYHVAKAKGVIAVRQLGAEIEVWVRDGLQAETLAEARRALGAAAAFGYLSRQNSSSAWPRFMRARMTTPRA